jgi:hypothetical protein
MVPLFDAEQAKGRDRPIASAEYRGRHQVEELLRHETSDARGALLVVPSATKPETIFLDRLEPGRARPLGPPISIAHCSGWPHLEY